MSNVYSNYIRKPYSNSTSKINSTHTINNFKLTDNTNINSNRIDYNISYSINNIQNNMSFNNTVMINCIKFSIQNSNLSSNTNKNCKFFNIDKKNTTNKNINNIINTLYLTTPGSRLNSEVNNIKEYLTSLPSFISFLSNIPESNRNSCLNIICNNLKHKSYLKNSLIFRYGDTGEYYYIILSGKIDVLIAKPESFKMCKEDFINYLKKLINLNEIELYNLISEVNKNIYDITKVEMEDISKYQKSSLNYKLCTKKSKFKKDSCIKFNYSKLIDNSGITSNNIINKNKNNELDQFANELKLINNSGKLNKVNKDKIMKPFFSCESKHNNKFKLNKNLSNVSSDLNNCNSEEIFKQTDKGLNFNINNKPSSIELKIKENNFDKNYLRKISNKNLTYSNNVLYNINSKGSNIDTTLLSNIILYIIN